MEYTAANYMEDPRRRRRRGRERWRRKERREEGSEGRSGRERKREQSRKTERETEKRPRERATSLLNGDRRKRAPKRDCEDPDDPPRRAPDVKVAIKIKGR